MNARKGGVFKMMKREEAGRREVKKKLY